MAEERTAVGEAEGEGRRGGRAGLPWRPWNLKGPEWRTAAWLGALLLAGLLLLTVRPGGASQAPSGAAPGGAATADPPASSPLQAEEESLAQSLQPALEAIAGAGTVTVRVHLGEGPVTEYASNVQQTESTSSQTGSGSGGTVTTQTSVDSQLAGGTSGGTPPVRAVRGPQVTGVLVIATGAGDATVRGELAAAVHAATGVPLYQVVVVPAAGGSTQG